MKLSTSLARYGLIALSCLSFPAFSQSTDTIDLGDLRYREVGPSRGGRVTAVAGVNDQPNVFYMGATGGGVWKTTDYGISWNNISDGYFGSPSIGDITVWQANPQVLYVGTGSDGLRSNVISGDGMYRSRNGGKTWDHIGLESSGHIGAVLVHPADSNTVYVAAIGQAYAPNSERGVFRSRDGGESWEKVLFISEETGFVDLEFHPENPDVIYAAAWHAVRKPWTIISGDEQENGIYKSTDGGNTWNKMVEGLPSFAGKIDLAVSPAEPDLVMALIEAQGDEGGLYRSDDQGQQWDQVTDNPRLLVRPFYFLNLDLDPTNADVVYVNTLRFMKSEDGGKEWRSLGTPHGDNHAMWINPNNPDIFVQGNDGGANVTLNGGASWSHQFNQPTAELYQVEVDNQHPYWLYAGQQDNYTAIAVPSLPPYSTQAGSPAYIQDVGGCETGPAVPSPVNPNIVYANCKGRFSVYNKATGQEQRYDVGAAFMYGHNPKDLKFRFQRVSPIHVSPHNPEVIYHTSQYVHQTTDGGKTWNIISPDLTAFEPSKQVRSGGPITEDITGEEFYSTIYAIRESKVAEGLIWVGANDGPVHVTRNGGETWTNVTPEGLPEGGRVDAVEPSPHDPAKAYVAVLRYQLGDWMPYIYRTNDYGQSWTLLTPGDNGIANGYPTRVVREDPDQAGLLYAGTEYGLFISYNDGETWQSIQGNLPITPISDINLHRGDLILSTMGRGFWILDQRSALQQFAAEAGKKGVLYPGNTQYRYRYSPYTSRQITSYPSYPSPGMLIDYELFEDLDQPLELDIYDAEGNLVRAFMSEPDTAGTEEAHNWQPDMMTGEIARAPSGRLSAEAGKHRFRWDTRHASGWDDNPQYAYTGGGPSVLPGKYTVAIRVGKDEFYRTEFTLEIDPRVADAGVTMEDLKKQEELALKVQQFMSVVDKQIYNWQEEADALKEKSRLRGRDAARLATLEKVLESTVTAEGAYPERKFQDQVSYLYYIVASADQVPGKDAFDRYAELKAEWAKIMEGM